MFVNTLREPLTHLPLIARLARRDLEARFRGSFLGLVWLLGAPLASLTVFAFVFSRVFSSRWPNVDDPKSFALILFTGLIIYAAFAENLQRATGLILENPSYVKKVAFPLEVLPWSAVAASLGTAISSTLILLVFYLFFLGLPPVTALWAPLIVAPLLLMTVGLSFILATMGVFLRDLRQMMPIITQLLMFLGPVIYPVSALPVWAQHWVLLNPITLIVEQLRDALFFAKGPDMLALAVYSAISVLMLVFGRALFHKARPAFSDVI